MRISRRRLLGSLAIAAPVLGQATTQRARAFAWVNELPKERLPAGVRHATFHSPSHKLDVGYCVFLPPSYEVTTDAPRRYPVVYYLHGGLVGSELLAIQVAAGIDAAMRDGGVRPAIYVFPNGGKVSHYDYPALDTYAEKALVRELIPHVDSTYRTIARREARGLEGFSAGARGAARIAFRHPDLFCSVVAMSGGHQHEKYIREHQGRSQVPPDCVFEPDNNTFDLARSYARQKQHRLKLMVVVGTEDTNYAPNLEWMKHLESLGIEYQKIVLEGVGHNIQVIQRAGLEAMQFHAENFGGAATKSPERQ